MSKYVYFDFNLREVLDSYVKGFDPPVTLLRWLIDPFEKVVLLTLLPSEGQLDEFDGKPVAMRIEITIYMMMESFCKSQWDYDPREFISGSGKPCILASTGDRILHIDWFVDPVSSLVTFRLMVIAKEKTVKT